MRPENVFFVYIIYMHAYANYQRVSLKSLAELQMATMTSLWSHFTTTTNELFASSLLKTLLLLIYRVHIILSVHL